jgi:hypothetical protein
MPFLQSPASLVILARDLNGFKEIGDTIPNPTEKNFASAASSQSWPSATQNTAVG